MTSWRPVPLPIVGSLLAPALLLVVVGLLAPWAVAATLTILGASTLAGALWVAAESRERRMGVFAADPWIPWGLVPVVGALLAALATTLCSPGLFVKDAGELATSALTLGVAHPTGFPAFCLAGRAMGFLPAGSLSFRTTLLSCGSLGAAGALAMALVLVLARTRAPRSLRVGKREVLASLLAAFVMIGSPTTWLHGTTVEVYLPSLVGLAGVVLCTALAEWRRDARGWVAGAFLIGLGLGGHVTWPLWGALIWVMGLVVALRRKQIRGALVPTLILAGTLGALVVAYLPLRSAREPVMDWGHPADLPGLLAHLTGARIRASFQDYLSSMTPATMAIHLREVLLHLWEGTGPLALFATMGLLVDPRGSGTVRWGLAATVIGDLVFAVRVNPMGIRDLQVNTPATWALAVLGADGLLRVSGWLGARGLPRAERTLVPACVVGIVAMAIVAPSDRDLRGLHAPREIVEEMAAGLPVGASLWTTTDDLSATVTAMQVLEGLRPDVLALVRQHLGDTRAVSRRLATHGGRPGEDAFREALERSPFEAGGERPEDALGRAVAALRQRGAVFMEPGEGRIDESWFGRFRPGFPVFEVVREAGEDLSWQAVADASRSARNHVPSSDRWTRVFLASCLRNLGNLLARRGKEEWAIPHYGEAIALDPTDVRAMHNLAVLQEARGRRDEALRWARRAVAVDPAYVRGWRTLARLAESAGEVREAERARTWWRRLSGGERER